MITVAVIDDEALVRSGLSLILGLADDITVVGTTDGHGAMSLVAEKQPDVVLLDIRMPGVNGLALLPQLRQTAHPPAVAMLTTFDSDEHLFAALEHGAAGFLLKDTDPNTLAQLVRALAAGGTVLAPGINWAALSSRRRDVEADALVQTLSAREEQVLRLLTAGLTNQAIALALHVSLGTVKDDISSVLEKLQVGSRVQAALIAARAGLATAPARHPDVPLPA